MEGIDNRKAMKQLNQQQETIKTLNQIIEILRKENNILTENYNELTKRVMKLGK